MRSRTVHHFDFTLANGEEIELEAEFKPVGHIDPFIKETPEGVVFGYLVHDEDCQHPIDDCDAMGKIHHHPRSRYGPREDHGYYKATGRDSQGELLIDEEKMQSIWHGKIMALPLKMFHIADLNVRREIRTNTPGDYRVTLRAKLADESAGDYSMAAQCRQAWAYRPEVPRDLASDIAERIEDAVDWDYNAVCTACCDEGDPDAVMLDVYDHGGCHWSISGDGMQCRWDTSRGAALWVPDHCLMQELKDLTGAERRAKVLVYAQQALDEYNAWSNGDCYGVVIQKHELDGTLIESDEVWGYIGGEYAKETLAAEVEGTVKYLLSPEARRNPNQMELL